MGDGVEVSRGNPRASSVGEEGDLEEVRYRSTTAIAESDVISIEDCGIPLDCSSGGDSFQPQDPCDNLDLTFYNVMGQEDRFRQIDGVRAQRGGTGRIVFTASDEVTVEKIEYVLNPSNENNPTFNKEWDPNPPPTDKHEIFVNISPDSLYAFRIIISVEGCPDTNTSGIYYFSTGDDVVFEPDSVNIADSTVEILVEISTISQTVQIIDQEGNSTVSPYGGDSVASQETISVFSSILTTEITESLSSTGFTTS